MSANATALAAAAKGTAVATERKRTVIDWLQEPRFAAGLQGVASKFLTPDRMLRLVVNAINRTPRLAECEPRSVLGSVMASQALGLEPNTVQQQAFLVPYKRSVKRGNSWVEIYECQFQIGYRGFVTLAYRSPLIRSIAAEAIHQADEFDHEIGSKTMLRYRKKMTERGGMIGAFCHVRMQNDAELVCLLPLDELSKIREKSEAYRSTKRALEFAKDGKERTRAERNFAETPWVMWADDMAAKSAIKKIAKQLPIASSELLVVAADLDDRGDGRRIDIAQLSDPDIARGVVLDGFDAPGPVIDHDDDDRGGGDAGDTGGQGGDTGGGQGETTGGAGETGKASSSAAKPSAKKGTPAKTDTEPDFPTLKRWLEEAKTGPDADVVLDQARSVQLSAEQYAELVTIRDQRFPKAAG